jgi:hypothetical protein
MKYESTGKASNLSHICQLFITHAWAHLHHVFTHSLSIAWMTQEDGKSTVGKYVIIEERVTLLRIM